MFTDISIVFASYLALGRTGAIISSFYLHENVVQTLVISLMLDFGQIPVFGFFLESTIKHTGFGRKIDYWIDGKRVLWDQRMNGGGFWAKVGQMQPLAIILVSMIPVRGCGIISACVLCFMMGMSRIYCTVLIMTGSVLGACVTLALLYEPIRLIHG